MLDTNAPVLVVDGFAPMRRITRKLLGELGYTNVAEAEDAAVARRLLQQRPFALVVLDHKTQHQGVPFAKVLRDDPALSGTKLLLVTAEKRNAEILATLPGANEALEKPFELDDLKAKLASLAGG